MLSRTRPGSHHAPAARLPAASAHTRPRRPSRAPSTPAPAGEKPSLSRRLPTARAASLQEALNTMPDSYLADSGALVVRSGAKTGRSPKDKRVVAEPGSEDNVWWGRVNIKMTEPAFMINRERAIDYLNTRKSVYVIDGYAGWDPAYRVRVRVVCALAYHALFMRNMLVMPEELPEDEREEGDFVPDFTILNAGGFPANRYVEGMTSSCSVDLHLGRMEMVILGTQYAGEMKKGVLTYMMCATHARTHARAARRAQTRAQHTHARTRTHAHADACTWKARPGRSAGSSPIGLSRETPMPSRPW